MTLNKKIQEDFFFIFISWIKIKSCYLVGQLFTQLWMSSVLTLKVCSRKMLNSFRFETAGPLDFFSSFCKFAFFLTRLSIRFLMLMGGFRNGRWALYQGDVRANIGHWKLEVRQPPSSLQSWPPTPPTLLPPHTRFFRALVLLPGCWRKSAIFSSISLFERKLVGLPGSNGWSEEQQGQDMALQTPKQL